MRLFYLVFINVYLMLLFIGASTPAAAQQTTENLNGRAGFSLQFAPPQINQANALEINPEIAGGSVAYGNNVWTNDFFSIDTDDPLSVNVIGKMTMQTASGDFHPDEPDFMYVLDINTNYLGKIDISTGETVDSVLVPMPLTDAIWTVLTIHKSTGEFFGVATNGSESNVYEINPVDGSTTLAFSTGLTAVISGTFDGTGMMWLFEIANDDIYKLDLDDADLEFVGPAGFNGNFAQGMGYDYEENEIYLAAYEELVGPQLRLLNTSTGEAVFLADLPGETTAFGFPGSAPFPDYHRVEEVYTDPGIEAGDTLHVLGFYINPEFDALIGSYSDFEKREVMPPHSFIKLDGLIPPDVAWNGGYLEVVGTVTFLNNPSPYHPEDSLTAVLDIFEIDVLVNSPEPDMNLNNRKSTYEPLQRDDCDSCKFAVLISGGINANADPDFNNNYPAFWEDLVELYNHKVASGYCPSNILVNYFDGNGRDGRIPAANISAADSASIAQSHQTIAERVAECTSQGKESTFQKMISNHGSPDGSINLLGRNTLDPEDLKEMQQAIIDSCCSTVYDEFTQCYAGYGVDDMTGLNTREKATIYVNSAADTNTSWGPYGLPHPYLQAKIDSLGNGGDYEDAVVAAKMAYDEYLQDVIDRREEQIEALQGQLDSALMDGNLGKAVDILDDIEELENDIVDLNAGICQSRNEKIVPFTEYCQWEKFVVPPGGQLVLKIEGENNNCGNVTVYKEDPLLQQTVKVKEWNWNVEGSAGYQEGNNQRVINGDPFFPCTFYVHNDNNGDFVRVQGSAKGNQDLEESPTNEMAFAGFSFGGNDGSADEFDQILIPEYFYEDIDQIPFSLSEMPGYFGPGYVQYFGFNFTVNYSDPYWQNMVLHLDIHEVMQPGTLLIIPDDVTPHIEVPITEPGVYQIPLGDMSFYNYPVFQIIAENVIFSVDSWGFRSVFDTPQPIEHLIEIEPGWSGISSYLVPENPDIQQMFSPLGEQLILLENIQGNLYWPEQGINTLQIWDPLQGYVVNMQQQGVLPVVGFPVENPEIPFNEGWNYLPVPVSEPLPVDLIFGGNEAVVLVKDIAGPGVFWPEYNINTIGELMPGSAYAAFLQQPATAAFDEVDQTEDYPSEPPLKSSLQTPWNPVNPIPNSHTVVFEAAAADFEEGDILGAFTGNNWCAGATEVSDPGSNVALVVNAADPSEETAAGFETGETIRYKLYRPQTHEIFELTPVYDPEMNTGDFALNGMSVVTSMKMSVAGMASEDILDVKLYPNPNDGSFTVECSQKNVEVSVFNAFGEVIYEDIKNGTFDVDLKTRPRGTYFVRLRTNTGTWIDKVVIY